MLIPRKAIKILLIVSLTVSLIVPAAGCYEKAETVKSSIIKYTKAEEFEKGTKKDIEITKKGDGEITISQKDGKYAKNGVFTSHTINTEPFHEMMLTCSSDTPEGTSVTFQGQVMVDGKWSSWVTWGTWGSYVKSGSRIKAEEDDLATLDVDALVVKGEDKEATAFKYRLILNTENTTVTPSVRTVVASIQNNAKPIESVLGASSAIPEKFDKVLNVPAFSQMIRDPSIASSICSPTSVSMVMNYYGVNVPPEQCAWGAYDYSTLMFGNWIMNCEYAASYGFDAYAGFFSSIDDIKREIFDGHPVVASVKYKSDETVDGDLPVLHGAPIPKTEGHLVVVCGVTHENGKEYFVVNDPAASDDSGVRVKYLTDEFDDAWVGVAYIIHEGDGGESKPQKLKAELVPTGKRAGMCVEYQLKYNGQVIDASNNYAKAALATKDGKTYTYPTPDSSPNVWFGGAQGDGRYTVTIIMQNGKIYEAEADWSEE